METVIVLKPIKNSGGIVDKWEEYEVDKELAMEQLTKPADQRNAHWKFAKLKSDTQTELTAEEKIRFELFLENRSKTNKEVKPVSEVNELTSEIQEEKKKRGPNKPKSE